MSERKMIYLCLAHMSEEKVEEKYVQEAFDTNWVVPMGPNVNAFEKDLEAFVNKVEVDNPSDRRVVCLSSGTAAVHLALIACGVKPDDEVCVQSFTFCSSSSIRIISSFASSSPRCVYTFIVTPISECPMRYCKVLGFIPDLAMLVQ